MSIIYKKNLY